MIDINLLKSILRQDAFATLSDAEAAAMASTPILTRRPGKATFTSLGDIWGLERVVTFRATLKALAAQTDNPTLAATADYAIAVLSGDGFDPGHPEAAKAGELFVQAKAATAQEIVDSQYTISYAAGDVATEKDVAEARRLIGLDGDFDARLARNNATYNTQAARWNDYFSLLMAWRNGGYSGDAPADLAGGQ